MEVCLSLPEAETACQKWGGLGVHEVGGYYFHSEYIWHRVLVFFMTTSNFGGAQLPLIKKWGGAQAPPAPPGSLPLFAPSSLTGL